jgi:hypothetical protein
MSTVAIVVILLLIVVFLYLLIGYTSVSNKSISLLSVPSVIEAKDIENQSSVNYLGQTRRRSQLSRLVKVAVQRTPILRFIWTPQILTYTATY